MEIEPLSVHFEDEGDEKESAADILDATKKFEMFLHDKLRQGTLGKVIFTGNKLTIEEKRVLNNLYIASIYYHVDLHTQQIKQLIENNAICLEFKFEYSFNFHKHNVELQGYHRSNVLDCESVENIENFKKNCYHNFFAALTNNDLPLIKQYCNFGMDVNSIYNGRLPLELTCENGYRDAALYLIDYFNADPTACNYNGINAIHQCCIISDPELLGLIIDIGDDRYVGFLDTTSPDYAIEKDVLRIIVDLDNDSMLQYFLTGQFYHSSKGYIDSDFFGEILSYAREKQKQKVIEFAAFQYISYQQLEKNLIDSIQNNDLQSFEKSIRNGVNVNKLINDVYPLELACKLGRIDFADRLLTIDGVRFFDFEVSDNQHVYDSNLDVVKIAIDTDNHEFLTAILKHYEGDPNYIHHGQKRLQNIYEYALKNNKANIVALVQQILQLRQAGIEQLFNAVVSGNIKEIGEALSSQVKINSILNGKTIMHVACELGHISAVRFLLQCENIDPNISDADGLFPITEACKLGNIDLVKLLMENQTVTVYGFNDDYNTNYLENLDLLRVAIGNDNAAMLEELLKHAQQSNQLLLVNYDNIEALRDYAFFKERPHCLLRLNSYVTTLSAEDTLFDIREQSDAKVLVDDSQGIQRVEASFISSIKRLCKRYNILVSPTPNGKHLSLQFNCDKHELLKSIELMIAQAENNDYALYRNDADGNAYFDRYLSDVEYKSSAVQTYNRLKLSFDQSADRWHSAWYEEGSETIKHSSGLLSAEIWCLALLAARDINAIPGKHLTALDIFDREQILVRTLVECSRAYAYDDDYFDTGSDLRPSCEHGVAVRALLALCGLHNDIIISENPLEWASSVASEELTRLFQASQIRDELSKLLRIHVFQLTTEQAAIVDEFYAQARINIEVKLISTLGMVSNGGHLNFSDLKKTLDSIRYINLPLIEEDARLAQNIIFSQPDFTKIACNTIFTEGKILMEQYKLPNTADSMYAAILISALDQRLDLPQCATVQELRNEVAEIILAALTNHELFSKFMYTKLNRCITNGVSGSVVCRIIKHKVDYLYPGNQQDKYDNYVYSVRNYAAPDILTTMILSAIYGCSISIYDLNGAYNLCLNSGPLSLHTKSQSSIHICCRNITDGQKSIQDFSIANALVTNEKWEVILPEIKKMGICSMRQRLQQDINNCNDYAVMLGRNISGMEQIKIPGDGNCAFNAVLLAARHAESEAAIAIANISQLRAIVQSELSIMCSSSQLNTQVTDSVQAYISDAIFQFNQQNSHRPRHKVYTPEEYINAIGADGTWAGELEMRIMCNILDIRINVFSPGAANALIIGEPSCTKQISLIHTFNHYNILVQPGTWHGTEILGVETERENKRAQLLF